MNRLAIVIIFCVFEKWKRLKLLSGPFNRIAAKTKTLRGLMQVFVNSSVADILSKAICCNILLDEVIIKYIWTVI